MKHRPKILPTLLIVCAILTLANYDGQFIFAVIKAVASFVMIITAFELRDIHDEK